MRATNGPVARAIWGTLQSPNECDRNGEAANIVDGLFAIARAIYDLADAVREARPEPLPARKPTRQRRITFTIPDERDLR